jgi:HK97 family phage portal protein
VPNLDASPVGSVVVNEDSALQLSAVWAAVRILGETMATLPLDVYKYAGNVSEKDPKHPVQSLLDAPNGYQNKFNFIELLQAHLCLHGNAYAYIERSEAGIPVALMPIHPERIAVKLYKGEKFFQLHDNEDVVYSSSEILHLVGLSIDGVLGLSVIDAARSGIELGLNADKYGNKFFSNGANVGGVLTHPGTLSDEAYKRLKSSWDNKHSSIEMAHKTAILEEGMAFKPTTIPNDAAQFLQTRRFQVEEIARMFRIPLAYMGDMQNSSTRANVEQQSIDFVRNTVLPWVKRWEAEFNNKLFTEKQRSKHGVRFNVDGLLRGDIATRYNSYSIARQWGWLSVNDIRTLENLPSVENGDIYITPLNMAEAGTQPQPEAPNEE